MAFKVDLCCSGQKKGYEISIGIGKLFHADTLQEVVYALEHYFKEGVLDKPYDYNKHIAHNEECNCCPLCGGD